MSNVQLIEDDDRRFHLRLRLAGLDRRDPPGLLLARPQGDESRPHEGPQIWVTGRREASRMRLS